MKKSSDSRSYEGTRGEREERRKMERRARSSLDRDLDLKKIEKLKIDSKAEILAIIIGAINAFFSITG